MSAEFDVGSLNEVRSEVKRAMATAAKRAVSIAAVDAAKTAQYRAQFKDHTHNLRKSIKPVQVSDFEWDVVAGGPDAPYARHVEYGTKAHVIEPKRRKALRWYEGGDDSGDPIFARRVNHPGTTGFFFMRSAQARIEDMMRAEIERSLAELFGGGSGGGLGMAAE